MAIFSDVVRGLVMWDLKREVNSWNGAMKTYQRWTGENVFWFEYNYEETEDDGIYSESHRAWYPPFYLPVFFADFSQGGPLIEQGDGMYSSQTLSVTFQVSEAINRFQVDPLDTRLHFSDRFAYGMPPSVYTVTNYERQGLVHGNYLTITATGRMVQDQEFYQDYFAADFFKSGVIY